MGNQQIENYEEEWRVCEDSETTEVSNFGRVRNRFTHKVRKLTHNPDGYLYCGAKSADGKWKTYKVHRLVAKAFLPVEFLNIRNILSG